MGRVTHRFATVRHNLPLVAAQLHRKVIAFLHPRFEKHFDCVPNGTYAVAIDDRSESLPLHHLEHLPRQSNLG